MASWETRAVGDLPGFRKSSRVVREAPGADRPLHIVDDLVRWVAASPGAVDVDLVASRDNGLALMPHPSVDGHREVLDDALYPAFHTH
jgi:hypothetical protein